MKRVIVLCLIFTLIFSGCGYTENDLNAAREEGYKVGYEIGYEEGKEDGFNEGNEEGYNKGYDDGYTTLKPIEEPQSGTILSGKKYSGSELTVTADYSSSYVVSLKNVYGEEKIVFYIRAGETVTIGVPADYLYVYFACGSNWYGYGKGLMFGEDTVYSKDDEMLDFTQYTWEYTFTPVYDGNFSETPSDENEFF